MRVLNDGRQAHEAGGRRTAGTYKSKKTGDVRQKYRKVNRSMGATAGKGYFLAPTLLVHDDAKAARAVHNHEVFGPVVSVTRFSDPDQAIAWANDSDYGLQAGIFTNDLRKAMRAWDELDVGGVVINDVPSFRVDNMPYGGVKDSGLGREGVKFAIEDMTEIRLLVIRDR